MGTTVSTYRRQEMSSSPHRQDMTIISPMSSSEGGRRISMESVMHDDSQTIAIRLVNVATRRVCIIASSVSLAHFVSAVSDWKINHFAYSIDNIAKKNDITKSMRSSDRWRETDLSEIFFRDRCVHFTSMTQLRI